MNTGQNFGHIEPIEPFSPGEYLPYGKFKCVSKKAEWKRTPKKGTPYLNIVWECVEGEHRGKTAFEPLWFTSKNAPRVKGWSESVMKVMLTSHLINEKAYEGRYAMVWITKGDPYNGKDTKNVQSYVDEEIANLNDVVDASDNATGDEKLGDLPLEDSMPNYDDVPPPGDEDLPF